MIGALRVSEVMVIVNPAGDAAVPDNIGPPPRRSSMRSANRTTCPLLWPVGGGHGPVQARTFAVHSPVFSAQDWLRAEWQRTGLAFNQANEACGVKNAATRKYLADNHVWYFPPPDVFDRLVAYANRQVESSLSCWRCRPASRSSLSSR